VNALSVQVAELEARLAAEENRQAEDEPPSLAASGKL